MSLQSFNDLIAARIDALPDRDSGLPACPSVRSTRKAAEWSTAIHRAYSYMSRRLRDPVQQQELDRYYEQRLAEGADFLKVRRNAEFIRVPVVTYDAAAAREIMKQAREIERETYANRAKGKHGGAIGRTALDLLEWFCFVMWPKARYGMFPSLMHIADGSRLSKETVTEAMKTLELFGFLTISRRRKRVETPFGVKQVQDTNCYVLNLAKGLGALALAVFRKPASAATVAASPASESSKPTAKEIHSYPKRERPRFFENLASRSVLFSTA